MHIYQESRMYSDNSSDISWSFGVSCRINIMQPVIVNHTETRVWSCATAGWLGIIEGPSRSYNYIQQSTDRSNICTLHFTIFCIYDYKFKETISIYVSTYIFICNIVCTCTVWLLMVENQTDNHQYYITQLFLVCCFALKFSFHGR